MIPLLLADHIPADVSGWWLSEKCDGVRVLWNGRRLLTRHGKDLRAPAWFTKDLPQNVRLDGELWMGRGTFDKLVSVIRNKDSDWHDVLYVVFDLADVGVFEDRQDRLLGMKLPVHVIPMTHHRLTGREQLDDYERQIVDLGGEGCVIRRPGCLYRPGRSGDVIKVKRLLPDLDRWQG